jgi:lipopolysaccharide/colanic/teichoic acid biosynthesis glycosyltransferase
VFLAIQRQIVANPLRNTGAVTNLWRTRIDKLPQMVNVLMENMSMVGTPTGAPVCSRGVRKTPSDYDLRFGGKPGITGLAKVAGELLNP